MIVRHLLAAMVAGLMAGIIMTVVQQARVVPLILQAEEYEGAPASPGDAHQHGASLPSSSIGSLVAQFSPISPAMAHEHDGEEESNVLFGLDRLTSTLGANIVAGGGFALLVAALSLLLGAPVTAANGWIWGACGWLAVQFLPAMGLPPELPGFPAADLAARQGWWMATVLASAIGLGLIAFRRELPFRLLGLLVILAPHVWGAPPAPSIETAVPAVIASEFAVAALGSALVMWLSLGVILGYLNDRFEKAA